jgi:hypothetical protein
MRKRKCIVLADNLLNSRFLDYYWSIAIFFIGLLDVSRLCNTSTAHCRIKFHLTRTISDVYLNIEFVTLDANTFGSEVNKLP